MNIITPENYFLIIIAVIWIIGAIMQDLRRREVDNIWNFSLIAFALGYRALCSISGNNYWFLLNGIIGLVVSLIIGNLFYYSRIFAGGDAKLVIALGAVLPLTYDWIINLKIFGIFVLFFLVSGSIYALIWSFFLVLLNFKKFKASFYRQWKFYLKLFYVSLIFFIILLIVSLMFQSRIIILLGAVIMLFPILFVFSKAVEDSCMIKLTPPFKVTEGDWLAKDITVGSKKIKANWEGVTKRELNLIKDKYNRKVLIKLGIPFTPSFLFGFLGLLILSWKFGWLIG